ncbi:DUF3168 domain-containing protein [Thermoactinomyces sp. FSL K6-2592]|jgi:hypothetical protein|uniref:DUF3168 domain-containing protein n=1 Tax=Thermoactinomyces sp. FSL K6-2592 TaxID=2975347 RepID=UPI0030F6CE92
MKSAGWELQKAIYSRLINDTALTEKVTGIFDDANGHAVPFVTIGEMSAVDWSTKTEPGQEFIVTLHTWSEYPGMKEVMEIHDLILQAITREPLGASGSFYFHFTRLVSEQTLRDPDGVTRHGVLSLMFNTEEV